MARKRRDSSGTSILVEAAAEASAQALARQGQEPGRPGRDGGRRGGDSTALIPHAVTHLPVADILDRVGGDTRPLTASHVEQLFDSIQVFGLIQPIVVDRQHRLLAGAHRLAALLTWRNRDPAAFQARFGEGVPVHVYDLDAAQDPERAVAVEISENEKRRDYSRAEAISMARRLIEQGYTHRSSPGAPRQGERMLVPALALLIGRSEKTIRRYLRDLDPLSERARTNVDTVQIRARTVNDIRSLIASPEIPADEIQVLRSALVILERLRWPMPPT